MTTFNKSALQAIWVNGYTPQTADYTNLIQSQVNIAETAVQAMTGPLSTTELNTPLVSAGNATLTGTLTVAGIVSAAGLYSSGVASLNVSNFALSTTTGISMGAGTSMTVSAATGIAIKAGGTLSLGGTAVSASLGNNFSLGTGGSITTSAAVNTTFGAGANVTLNAGNAVAINGKTTVSGGLKHNVAIISAAGTTQATAAAVTAFIGVPRLQGTADGQTTGFLLPSPSSAVGLVQFMNHEGAVSGNLYPSVGCKINALSTNTPFPLVANTPYVVSYLTASAYAVK